MSETFADWLEAVDSEQSGDLDLLAKRAIAEVPHLAAGVIVREIEHLRRGIVKGLEARHVDTFVAYFAGVHGRVPGRIDPDVRERFSALLAESFALGDRSRVTWGSATIEQHKQRIALLVSMRKGIDVTIHRHELAVRAITRASATCLDELVRNP